MESSTVFKNTRSQGCEAVARPSKTGEVSPGRDDIPGLTLTQQLDRLGGLANVARRQFQKEERDPNIFGSEDIPREGRARDPKRMERGGGLAEVSHVQDGKVYIGAQRGAILMVSHELNNSLIHTTGPLV